jgi:hypothetical protein
MEVGQGPIGAVAPKKKKLNYSREAYRESSASAACRCEESAVSGAGISLTIICTLCASYTLLTSYC